MLDSDWDGSSEACIALVLMSSIMYLQEELMPKGTSLLLPLSDVRGLILLSPSCSYPSILLCTPQHVLFQQCPSPTLYNGPSSSLKPLQPSHHCHHCPACHCHCLGCSMVVPISYVWMAPDVRSLTSSGVFCMCKFTEHG